MAVPEFVRQSADANGTTSPLNITITAGASGNTLVVFVSSNRGSSAARTVTGITCTNVTFTQIGTINNNPSRTDIWFGTIAGGSSGTTVAVTFSGTVASGCSGYVEEWSGVLTSGTILGATATTNTGTSTSPSITSFTPLQKDSLVVAALGYQSSTAPTGSPGAPWAHANDAGTSSNDISGVSQQVNSASAQTASWTIGATGDVWATVCGELRSQVLTLSVNDSATVTESVTVAPTTRISVNDSATTTESQTIVKVNIVNVNDSATVTESRTIVSVSQVNVNDTSTVVDIPVYPIHDNVTVTESVSLSVISPGGTLSVSVFDSSTVTESVALAVITNASINDSSTVTESVSLTLQTGLSVNDASTATESTTLAVSGQVSVNDASVVTDSCTDAIVTGASVNDSCSGTESVSLSVQTNLSVNDSSTVTESVTIVRVEAGTDNVSVSDSATVTESIQIVVFPEAISVFDSSTIIEFVQLSIVSPVTGTAEEVRTDMGMRVGTGEASVLIGGFG